ncbi:Immunoglobulin lambda-1 light chain [Merluccius polli]|nr:Immunoglobulin lambda-1 light chain [Merluccius polli]
MQWQPLSSATPADQMLLLSRAAWSALCLAVVAMAAELTQDQVSWSRREGTAVSFRCTNTDQCNTYILWYQKKETETFTLILLIVKSDGRVVKGSNHPQEDDFSSVLKENSYELSLQKVKVSHSATYYCSCGQPTEVYVAGYFTVLVLIFGGGTTLVVTDTTVEKPKVSVYPATGADLKGRRSLLCVARDMVPEVVRVSWRRKGGGGTENEGEQLELRGLPYAASILVIDQQETLRDQYICRVEHESGLQVVEIPGYRSNRRPRNDSGYRNDRRPRNNSGYRSDRRPRQVLLSPGIQVDPEQVFQMKRIIRSPVLILSCCGNPKWLLD